MRYAVGVAILAACIVAACVMLSCAAQITAATIPPMPPAVTPAPVWVRVWIAYVERGE